MRDLCPRCGKREIEPNSPLGWCAECIIEDLRERYGEKQRIAASLRSGRWAARSWDRDRQRVHRLRSIVKPLEPASYEDPWELAAAALLEINKIRTVSMRAEQVARLDVIAEALRRLAWGPDGSNVISITTRARFRRRREIPGQLSLFPELVSEAA